MTDAPAPPIKKFPWPFADHEPSFTPRSIDPRQPAQHCPAWAAPVPLRSREPKPHRRNWEGIAVAIIAAGGACIWASALLGWRP